MVIITRLLQWRSEGLVDEIILSTWKEELHEKPHLQSELRKYGITTISSDPVDLLPMHAYFMHQHATLFNGLSLCSSESLVFRIRADRDSASMKQFLPALRNREVPQTTAFGSFPEIFQGKIHTIPAWLSMPFLLHDNVIYAQRQDLEALSHFNVKLHSLCRNGLFGAEATTYAVPFLQSFRELLVLFRDFDLYLLSRALISAARMSRNNFVMPEFLNEVFAVYFAALHSQFSLIPFRNVDSDFEIRFDELFAGTNERNKPVEYSDDRSIGIGLNDSHLSKITGGGLVPSPGYEKFMEAVGRLRDHGCSFGRCLDGFRFHMNKESENEIVQFLHGVNLAEAYTPRITVSRGNKASPVEFPLFNSRELSADSPNLSLYSDRINAMWMDAVRKGEGIHEVLKTIAGELAASSEASDVETAKAYYEEAALREAPDFVYQRIALRKNEN